MGPRCGLIFELPIDHGIAELILTGLPVESFVIFGSQRVEDTILFQADGISAVVILTCFIEFRSCKAAVSTQLEGH